jgi:rubrerythrin
MNASKEELIGLLSKQRKLELTAVESLSSLVALSKNDSVRLLLSGLMQDSKKHAQVLETVIDFVQAPTLGHVEELELTKGVEKHIEIEEEMLTEIDKIIEKAKSKEIKVILGHIAMEEKRHYESLIELREMIEHITTVTEDALWDYLNRWANFSG